MDRKITLFALFGILISFTFISANAFCLNGYEAYYFSRSRVPTSKVLFATEFKMCSLTALPAPGSGNYIGSILTVNGGSASSGPSKYGYQSYYVIWNTGSITWAPQIINPSTWWIRQVDNIDTKDYTFFYSKISIEESNAVFRSYAYPNDWSVEHDTPTIVSRSTPVPSSHNTLFNGNEIITRNGKNYNIQYLQTGVEATFNCTNYNIFTFQTAYYYQG